MAYIIVEMWSSKCSKCGGNASPDDTTHDRGGPRSGWVEGSSLSDHNGCGATFTHRYSSYGSNIETDINKPFW